MANSALRNIRTVNTQTPQTEKAVSGQKKNSAGGYTFTITDLDRAKRFLILGSDSSYYNSAEKLSKQNATLLMKLAESEHAEELVDLIVEVSTAGRAPKQDPALFALAVASVFGSASSKAKARAAVPAVARTASALFTYTNFLMQFVKTPGSRGLKSAIAAWYTEKDADKLAYQMVKYRERDGMNHSRLLRMTHPKAQHDDAFNALSRWALRKEVSETLPRLVVGFLEAQQADNAKLVARLVREYGLSWEMLPTQMLNEPEVWKALLDGNVPLGALIRQLPRLTRIGVIQPLSAETKKILARLTDPTELERARIHPLNILLSLKTYASGRSLRGDSSWTPNRAVIDALDKAFYLAFKTVVPAGKRTLIGLDVSGSMGWNQVAGVPLTPREATAALALVTMATEPETHVIGFTGGGRYSNYSSRYNRSSNTTGPKNYSANVTELSISPRERLDDVVRKISGLPFGATDCALPMLYAMEKGLEVDTFVVATDNETWAGSIHPFEALRRYREKFNPEAKLIVLSTEATRFSIADPNDPGMLDLAGFDSATPALVAEFSRGL